MTTIPTEERVVGVKEAAARLGVSTWTIRRYIRGGQLPAFRVGTGHNAPIRIKVSDVAAMRRDIASKERAKPLGPEWV